MADPNIALLGAAAKQAAHQPHSPLKSMLHTIEERAKYVHAGALSSQAGQAGEAQGRQDQRAADMKYLYIGVAALAAWYFLMQ